MRLQCHLQLIDTTAPEIACMKEDKDKDIRRPLKVAFATSDLHHVDQHFGMARRFAIYEVTETTAKLLEAAQFAETARDGNEDKLNDKFKALKGCDAVYCQAAGGSAVRQLLAMHVQPLKVESGIPINSLIALLQQSLRSYPPIWVANAWTRNKSSSQRFDNMAKDDWRE